MSRRQPFLRSGIPVVLVALVCAGCSSSPQMGAKTFLEEHSSAAARVAAATKQVQAQVAQLSSPPTSAQLQLLAKRAAEARRELIAASEWNVAGQGQEGAEEEDVPRAEAQVTESASELAAALAPLRAPGTAPSAATLARYRSKLASASGQWDEGISQLWYLAHAAHPPTI